MKVKDKKFRVLVVGLIILAIVIVSLLGITEFSKDTSPGGLSQESTSIDDGTIYCCERTSDGKWCELGILSYCNPNYYNSPTSCDLTPYCALGYCADKFGKGCFENITRAECESDGGKWGSDMSVCS